MNETGNKTKILVIMGSPHKGNTFQACEELREYLEQEILVDFEYLWLKDKELLPCKGCLACFLHGEDKCPIHDAAQDIHRKMREASGVIFATPVYGMNVTSQMKLFIDRFSFIFHRPEFFDKKALLLTTAGVLGNKEVLKYLDLVARIWGFEIAGTAGLITSEPFPRHQKIKNQNALKEAAKQFSVALKRRVRKNPDLNDLIIFHGQRAAFSELESFSPADYQYWKENGWFEKGVKYFVDIPVNPLYLGIAKIIGWLSGRQIRKDLIPENGGDL